MPRAAYRPSMEDEGRGSSSVDGRTPSMVRGEIGVVLAMSLLEAAVFATIDLFSAPIRGEVRVTFPQVGLADQLAIIAFGLAPVWLVVHLLHRDGEDVRTVGLSRARFGRAVLGGAGLAVAVGTIGLVLYLAAVASGLSRAVVPVPPLGVWWSIPILVLGAASAALLEEIVVVGYLITRLRQLGWRPAPAIAASAFLRGAYHLYQGWGAFVGNVAMGALFGWIFVRGKRLWPLIIAHFLLDVAAGLGYIWFGDLF